MSVSDVAEPLILVVVGGGGFYSYRRWVLRPLNARLEAARSELDDWPEEVWQSNCILVLAAVYDLLHRHIDQYVTRQTILEFLGEIVDAEDVPSSYALNQIVLYIEQRGWVRFGRGSKGEEQQHQVYLTGSGAKEIDNVGSDIKQKGATTVVYGDHYEIIHSQNVAVNSSGVFQSLNLSPDDAEFRAAVIALAGKFAEGLRSGKVELASADLELAHETSGDLIQNARSFDGNAEGRKKLRTALLGLKGILVGVATSALTTELTTEVDRLLHLPAA